MRWRNKLDLVYLSHYLACILCFVVFFADVPRFIIKQAMGVSHPSHSTEENTKKRINTQNFAWWESYLHRFFTWRLFDCGLNFFALDICKQIGLIRSSFNCLQGVCHDSAVVVGWTEHHDTLCILTVLLIYASVCNSCACPEPVVCVAHRYDPISVALARVGLCGLAKLRYLCLLTCWKPQPISWLLPR